jgi:protein-S-isoprenylcysteine O-methyltransferase Ste14
MEERPHLRDTFTYAPSIFILFVTLSFFADVFVQRPISSVDWLAYLGMAVIALGTFLAFSAYKASIVFQKDAENLEDGLDFFVGPYRYLRHPVYVSFLLLGLGFACVLNSQIMLISVLVLFVIMRFIVLQEEILLEIKYQEQYRSYQQNVRRFF